jgi:hypothetical protein
VVFFVGDEVVGEKTDSFAQKSDLDFRRACILRLQPIVLDDFRLVFFA